MTTDSTEMNYTEEQAFQDCIVLWRELASSERYSGKNIHYALTIKSLALQAVKDKLICKTPQSGCAMCELVNQDCSICPIKWIPNQRFEHATWCLNFLSPYEQWREYPCQGTAQAVLDLIEATAKQKGYL